MVFKPAGFVGFNTVTNTRSGRLAGNWKGSEVGTDLCSGPCQLSVTSGVSSSVIARHYRVAVKPPPSFPPETARKLCRWMKKGCFVLILILNSFGRLPAEDQTTVVASSLIPTSASPRLRVNQPQPSASTNPSSKTLQGAILDLRSIHQRVFNKKRD